MEETPLVFLSNLRATQVHFKINAFNGNIDTFGLTLSDGQHAKGGEVNQSESWQSVDLPENLKSIYVVFCRNEFNIHSMAFYGRSVVRIGATDPETVTNNQKDRAGSTKVGRVERLALLPGEELLGCEIHYNEIYTYGVTWLTWRPPRI